jgi:hypothetical protein
MLGFDKRASKLAGLEAPKEDSAAGPLCVFLKHDCSNHLEPLGLVSGQLSEFYRFFYGFRRFHATAQPSHNQKENPDLPLIFADATDENSATGRAVKT